MDAEAFLLSAGANDSAAQSDFDQDINLPATIDPPRPRPSRPQSAQVGTGGDQAGARPSKFNLQQAIHAKPFVPRSHASQQVRCLLHAQLRNKVAQKTYDHLAAMAHRDADIATLVPAFRLLCV